MHTLSKITDSIIRNEEMIIASIASKDLETYRSIQNEYLKGNVTANDSFQYKFSTFYRLYGAALTSEFKSAYFKLMEDNRNTKDFENWQIKEILLELYNYKNFQGNNCIQFSFTTKLMHTINNDLPIYDSLIKKVFGLKVPYYYLRINDKINSYLDQYDAIKRTYRQILEENILSSVFNLFNSKFPDSTLSEIKVLDFIFWEAGKMDL